MLFTSALDLQLVIGGLLYFVLSPLTTAGFSDFGQAMGNAVQRFFLVEHGIIMIMAIVLAHIGSAVTKKASDDKQRYQRAMLFYSLALVLILLAIPWYRPLFRGL